MAVEFIREEKSEPVRGKPTAWVRVEAVDLVGGRRVLGFIESPAGLFRPRGYFEPLEAEELERIAERIHSIRRKRRQALREANDGRAIK